MPQHKIDVTQKAFIGMSWMGIAGAMGKLSGILSQFFLGWMLAKEDYALYATAISLSSIFLCVKDGGLRKILIQRGLDYPRLAQPIFRLSLGISLIFAIVMVFGKEILSDHFDDPILGHLLLIIAISLPLSIPSQILSAKLAIDLKFKSLAKINTQSSLLRQSSMVFLAWMGFGVYSFVLPLVLVALFEWYVLYRYAGHWPMRGARFEISEAKELFRKSKWIVLTAFSSMLIMQGSTLVLSFSKVENLISSFFFGFQLTSAISSLMTTCFSSVLLPSFKEIENRGENLNKAYQDITYKVIFVSAVLFSLYYLVGPIFVNLVWQGKWDSAIPVIQFLGLGIIFRMPNPIGSALLEARGLWKLNAQLSYVNAVGTVCFTAVGVWLGGLYEVALCVACFRLCYGTFQVVVVARVMDMSILPFVIKLYQPVLYCLGLVLILGYIDFGLTALVQVGLKVLVYAILTFPWLIYLYDFNRGGSKVYE